MNRGVFDMRLILLGPPAAGKGTQAEFIADRYSLAHISTGDMLRAEIAAGTPLGVLAKSIIDDGNLVPDDVINAMVERRIGMDDCKNGFLLDGYPRTLEQAAALSRMVRIDAVLDIDVDGELLIARVASRRVCPACGHSQSVHEGEREVCAKCGGALTQRPDDTPERMRHRLDVYRERTHPLIRHYTELEKLVPIDGSRTISEVAAAIFERLDAIAAKEENPNG